MASGITAALESKNYDVPRWLKETIIRQMGVCVSLRDYDNDLSEVQIKKALASEIPKESDDSHLIKARDKAKAEYVRLKKRTNAEWKAIYAMKRESAQIVYDVTVKEYNEKKTAHEKSLSSVNQLLTIARQQKEGAIVVNSLISAKQQLENTIEWDYKKEPEKASCLTHTLSKWSARIIEAARMTLQFREEEITKEKVDVFYKERLSEYESFVKFVDTASKKLS